MIHEVRYNGRMRHITYALEHIHVRAHCTKPAYANARACKPQQPIASGEATLQHPPG
jgi:hypothetical protein